MATYWNNKTKVIVLAILVIVYVVMHVENVRSGTYTSTKHGTSADRSAISGVGPPYSDEYFAGHCAHCHDQHASVGGDEPVPPAAEGATPFCLFKDNYGANKNELCYACHDTFALGGMPLGTGRYGIYQGSTRYTNSVHNNDPDVIFPTTAGTPGGPAYDDYGNCHNCHNPHGQKKLHPFGTTHPQNSMLFYRPYSGAMMMGGLDTAIECLPCHDADGPAGKDIESVVTGGGGYINHVNLSRWYSWSHILPEEGYPERGADSSFIDRHVLCVDCHNPHTIGGINTSSPSVHPDYTVARTSNSDDQIYDSIFGSGALQGVWGVQPTSYPSVSDWPAAWPVQSTSWTVRKLPADNGGAIKEYQICFKCHSYYGKGPSTDDTWTVAGDFNINNRSAHPVGMSLNDRPGQGGWYSGLIASKMRAPWNVNVGAQRMYCSDCHGNDKEGPNDPVGVHGSDIPFMLRSFQGADNHYWPNRPDGDPWTFANVTADIPYAAEYLFCRGCHAFVPITGVHGIAGHTNCPCTTCHTQKIHGGQQSRLIDPSKMTYNKTSEASGNCSWISPALAGLGCTGGPH